MKILTGLIVCAILLICVGCGGNRVAKVVGENKADQNIILTTMSWEDRTLYFLSTEKTEVKGKKIIIHSPIGMMGGKGLSVDWSLPIKSPSFVIRITPSTANCWVCMNGGKCILFPKEIE